MRLLFVIDCLGSGGAQRQMVSLAVELKRLGHEIEFFVYYPEFDHFLEALSSATIPGYSEQKVSRFSISPVFALRKLIKQGDYDGILAFLDTPSLYAEFARIGTRIPLVLSERSAFSQETLSVARWSIQHAHHLADHIVVNSHHQRTRMQKMFPWMRTKISTIYNGVNLQIFKPLPTSKDRDHKEFRFLVLSSVVPKKNAIGLVRAMAYYKKHYGRTFRVDWAGRVSSDPVSQREFQNINDLLATLALTDCWNWLGECTNVPELLPQYDALIHPSFYEGLPNAVCEALACGIPALVSDVGDHGKLVSAGKTGFLFDPHDPLHFQEPGN